MSALDANLNLVGSFKPIVAAAVWDAYDFLSGDSIPLKVNWWKVKINVQVPVSSLAPLIELLVGPRPVKAAPTPQPIVPVTGS